MKLLISPPGFTSRRFLRLLHLATGFRLLAPAPTTPARVLIFILILKHLFLVNLLINRSKVHVRDFYLVNNGIGDSYVFIFYFVFQLQLIDFRLSKLISIKFRLDLWMSNCFAIPIIHSRAATTYRFS